MSKVIRSVKNVTKGYSSVQVKVREATSNDPWGPTGTQMSELAQLTYNSSTEFYEIMDMLDKRLNDKGKNWRHVLKALKVMDYCLHEGSELVVTWAKQNIFIIKTLREFIYVDEEGRDVGQNVRVAAKELTSLLLDEERLRAERSDRRMWKFRVMGLDESLGGGEPHQPPRRRPRRNSDDEDLEYKLAIEASKNQEEEDKRKREHRAADDDDDDLAKAIKLSKEEEARRRRELEESNATSLFDVEPAQSQPQYTGFNQGYQQGNAVDFFANPIDQSHMQPQQTGYMQNPYGQFQNQPTGYQNGYATGFGMQDPYGQQALQQQQTAFMSQPTGYNMFVQQQQSPMSEPSPQPGTNNPWASNNSLGASQQALRPMPTGSNNPFAQQQKQQQQQQQQQQSKPQSYKAPSISNLGPLPEQKTLSTFNSQPPQDSHTARLNALLASGEGMDTFGNTGQLRIPAQHTAPGTFVNSAGAGLNRVTADKTGNNPFLMQQYTGMPTVSYQQQLPAATGPAGMAMNGYGGGMHTSHNPFAAPQQQSQQQHGGQGDLIQF